jgi:hypothetical protein
MDMLLRGRAGLFSQNSQGVAAMTKETTGLLDGFFGNGFAEANAVADMDTKLVRIDPQLVAVPLNSAFPDCIG